jgi:ComF family protein
MFATNIISDFLNLLFPRICACCDEVLLRNEPFICTQCLYELPRTNFQYDPQNEVAQMFWGRVYVENAMSFLYFHKGGLAQKLLHKLKYKGQQEIGYELGKMIGRDLLLSHFCDTEIVVPVPLHKHKLRKRGYNQSGCIAMGIAEIMGKQLDTTTLFKTMPNPTQTRKHRYDRWTNVEGIYALREPGSIANKHIMLVDDVVTTGATLEACTTALLQAENVKVSIVTVAKA